jgi:hypothetical protein
LLAILAIFHILQLTGAEVCLVRHKGKRDGLTLPIR